MFAIPAFNKKYKTKKYFSVNQCAYSIINKTKLQQGKSHPTKYNKNQNCVILKDAARKKKIFQRSARSIIGSFPSINVNRAIRTYIPYSA